MFFFLSHPLFLLLPSPPRSFLNAASLTGFALWFSVSFPIVKPEVPSSAPQPQPGGTQRLQGEPFEPTKTDGAEGAAGEHTARPSTRGAHDAGDGEGRRGQADESPGASAEGGGSSTMGDCSEMLVLSTGPEDVQTHWQQVGWRVL